MQSQPASSDDMTRFALEAKDQIDTIVRKGIRLDTKVKGGTVRWQVWGEGPPLLLVHGGAGSWTHWIRNVEVLARRFRVLAPDLPGCGESRFINVPDNAPQLAELLMQALNQLVPSAQSFHIIGFSFGGIVSGLIARKWPDRVQSVLIAGGVGLGLKRRQRPVLRRLTSDMSDSQLWDASRMNLKAFMIANSCHIDTLATYIHLRNTVCNHLRSSSISRTEPLAGKIEQLRCPVFLVWGAEDNLYYQDTAERVRLSKNLMHPTTPIFIGSAGHWVQYEAPDEFNRLVCDHIRK